MRILRPDTRPILAAHGLEEESAKVLTHAKQTRTHVAHPPIIPSEEKVRQLMKALALKEEEEAALPRGLVCLKLLNTRLCERDANDMSSN